MRKEGTKFNRKQSYSGRDDSCSSLNDSAISLSANLSCSSSTNSGKNGLEEDDREQSSSKSSAKRRKRAPRSSKKQPKQYVCNVCQKHFMGNSDLRKHLLIHSDERPFPCQFCDKKFRQAVCLKNHIAAIHGTDKKFSCEHCEKKFPIKERLRLHMRVHLGQKPYSCPSCPKTFARGGQLKQHLVTHTGGNKHTCDKCTASFSSLGNLRLHAKVHTDEQKYNCEICNKVFFRSDDLRRHLVGVHMNSKTFNCDICKKTLKGHLEQHMKVHTNVRPFGCETCGAQFCQKSQLNVHQRTHSGERPYRCQVCWRAFAHSSVLKLHIRKHTGEKPFECLLCKETGIAFSQLAHLKTHMRTIHLKDKPYMCEVCQEFFKTKAELRIHCENYCSTTTLPISKEQEYIQAEETASLSRLRLFTVVLLKKISSKDRLVQLGFEKRLIDNIIMDALKIAGRKFISDSNLSELERLRLNIKEFLEWTIPEPFMQTLKQQQDSIEKILEDLAWTYSKNSED